MGKIKKKQSVFPYYLVADYQLYNFPMKFRFVGRTVWCDELLCSWSLIQIYPPLPEEILPKLSDFGQDVSLIKTYRERTSPVNFLLIHNRDGPDPIGLGSYDELNVETRDMIRYPISNSFSAHESGTLEGAILFRAYEGAAMCLAHRNNYLGYEVPKNYVPNQENEELFLVPEEKILLEIPWSGRVGIRRGKGLLPHKCVLVSTLFNQNENRELYICSICPPFPGRFLNHKEPIYKVVLSRAGSQGSLFEKEEGDNFVTIHLIRNERNIQNLNSSDLMEIGTAKVYYSYEDMVDSILREELGKLPYDPDEQKEILT